jgi:hypothetical protein
MPATPRRTHRIRAGVLTVLGALVVLCLCAFQFGDRNDLNGMPFAQVQPLASDLERAKILAKQGNIDLLAGETVPGEAVSLRGELTDANCYLGSHTHAYDHAFCAKLCAAAGGPLVFVPDRGGGHVYVVLASHNGVRLPESVLDRVGVPGVLVKGRVLDTDGLPALAIDRLAP